VTVTLIVNVTDEGVRGVHLEDQVEDLVEDHTDLVRVR
jgi:hypothetical protein